MYDTDSTAVLILHLCVPRADVSFSLCTKEMLQKDSE